MSVSFFIFTNGYKPNKTKEGVPNEKPVGSH